MKYQFLALLVILVTACGGGQEQTTEQSAPQSMVQEETEVEAEPVVVNEAGKKVYDQYCLVCHQVDGKGVPNAFPPLIQTDYVNGDTDRLIGIENIPEELRVEQVMGDEWLVPNDPRLEQIGANA